MPSSAAALRRAGGGGGGGGGCGRGTTGRKPGGHNLSPAIFTVVAGGGGGGSAAERSRTSGWTDLAKHEPGGGIAGGLGPALDAPFDFVGIAFDVLGIAGIKRRREDSQCLE